MGPIQRLRANVRWGKRLWDWEEERLDRKLGVDTGGAAEIDTLTVRAGDPSTGILYRPTPARVAQWWLRELPRDVTEWTFIDMGSGKGRVLLFAAKHGFRRSMGVEFAEELHTVALENARAARAHGVEIEPILGDAGEFAFPLDPLVVHFNNPFTEPVMEKVIANLSASYERNPRPIVAVYQQWYDEPEATRTRNLDLLEEVPFLTGRTLVPRRFVDRKLLQGYVVRIFESPQLNGLERSQRRSLRR